MKGVSAFVGICLAVLVGGVTGLIGCTTTTPEVMADASPVEVGELTLRPRNVIILIGDGMGITQVTAGMYQNDNFLNLERCTSVGLHKQHSASHLITDSAAGATAFSTGVKTYNGAVGVGIDSLPLTTLFEQAEAQGRATGLVATSTIVHATPAAFFAHVKSRQLYEDIAAQFVGSGLDFFVGGGRRYFERRETDARNISDELVAQGYVIDNHVDTDWEAINPDPTHPFGYFTADGDPLPASQGRTYLAPATRLACNFLNRSNQQRGFVLMVEGSQIDWAGHANNSEYIISEMIDFDLAVGEALDFAQRDSHTLVVVTADHETGGYAINLGSNWDTIVGKFTTANHTATLIPVFAYGPGAKLFSGIYDNTAIYDKLRQLLNL